MPSDMGLFNEIKFYSFLLILLLLGEAVAISDGKILEPSDRQKIYEKLQESADLENRSLGMSYDACLQALELSKKVNEDSLVVKSLLQMGDLLSLQGKKQEALDYFKEGYQRSDSVHYDLGKCKSLLEEGYIYYGWGRYDYSLSFFEDALKIANANMFKQDMARALTLIGKYYHTTGKYDQSVYYYNQAAKVSEELLDYDRSVKLFLNIGKTYLSKEDIYMTLSYYLKAYDKSEKLGNKLLMADVYNHLGSIYLLLKQPEKSLDYHRKALFYRNALNAPEDMATSYNNMGETYLYLAEYDSASIVLKKSYKLCLQTQYRKGIVKALTNLGRVDNKTGKLSEAKQYLEKALSLSKEAGYNAGIVESSLTIAENYLLQNKFTQAIKYFELSLSKMIPANMHEFKSEAYSGLYTSYLKLGDIKKALDYHVLLNEADKKRLQAQSNRQLAELRVSFDLERKEIDNQKLRQENELKQLKLTQRNWIMWSIAVILVFTIILCLMIYARYVQKRKGHYELQKVIRELELANVEKDKMFSIIAHELRNPLYWFQNLTEVLSKKHTKMTPQKLEKSLLSIDESAKNAFHLMDNLLNWSRTRLNRVAPKKGLHNLGELVEENIGMFESVVEQKQIKLRVEIRTDIMIYADNDMMGCVVRNLVSNAIKYTPFGGEIHIEAEDDDKYCTLHVKDSGIGVSHLQFSKLFQIDNFDSAPGLMQEKGSGLGLKLCKEFTELNDGEIWAKSSEMEQGTCFSLKIPVASA